MTRKAVRMPDSVGYTVRIPNDVMTDIRKMRAALEVRDGKRVTLNAIMVEAMRTYSKTVSVV